LKHDTQLNITLGSMPCCSSWRDVLMIWAESKEQVPSGEDRVISPAQRRLQEDWQEMGVESSTILRAAAPVTEGDLSLW